MKTHINGNTIEQVMTNVVTLTQQQYDLLPNEQKTHGTYIISDANSPDISATNVAYSTGVSVKDKIDSIQTEIDAIGGTMYRVVISATTDSSGNINSNLSSNEYIYIGTTASTSLFFIPLNALSDGKIRIRVLDANMNLVTGIPINQWFYFWKIG